MKETPRPLLICMTPIRNEAWVLHAFLKATSLWADYIIIADQCSTDGSREIALSYPKVILIENNNSNYSESDRQKLLINRARQIEGDKILFGLDADEVFSANFKATNDWIKILNSKPGDVFTFQWALILADQKHIAYPSDFFAWVFHDDDIEPHGNYAKNIHSMRIPYPIDENQISKVNDFKVLHLAVLDQQKVESKMRFYKIIDYELNKKSIITLSRYYYYKDFSIKEISNLSLIPTDWIYKKPVNEFDLFENIELHSKEYWYDIYIRGRIEKTSQKEFSMIDIWNKDTYAVYNQNDPRSFYMKIIHWYLKKTQQYSNILIIRLIDKTLKFIGL